MYNDLQFPKQFNLSTTGITQSRIACFMKCPVCFLYACNRYRSKFASQYNYGNIIHDVLDKTYDMYRQHKQLPLSQDIKDWVGEYVNDHKEELGNDWNEIGRDMVCSEIVIPEYLRYYKSDFDQKIVFTECYVEGYFYDFLLKAKVDLGLQFNDGFVFTMDHKTSSRIVETTLIKVLSLIIQHPFYGLIIDLSKAFTVGGSYHNIIRNPKSEFKGDWKEFASSLQKEIRRKPDHYFKRIRLAYSDQDKRLFQRELSIILGKINDTLHNPNELYRNTCSCDGKFTCEYLTACSSESLTSYKQVEHDYEELQEYGSTIENGKVIYERKQNATGKPERRVHKTKPDDTSRRPRRSRN
jgi:hypothetical protein